jgi:methionyl-tRNA formyltransferase
VKIIFAGTPEFAAVALQALLDRQSEIIAVLTQPDRPAGRGMQLQHSPVKRLALRYGLQVLQPANLKGAEMQDALAAMDADVMIVAAYGLILPEAILKIPRLGCLNIHASLLPRWRGAAPIQRAILAGDTETGITIMQMDVGLDTGDMLLKKACPIQCNDTAQTLHDKLSGLGGEAVVEVLTVLEQGHLVPEPQNNAEATYAAKLSKSEAQINWGEDATKIERMVRAYNPYPVAQARLRDTMIKIWRASLCTGISGAPGTVLSIDSGGIVVACGRDALCLEVLQRPNAKAMPSDQFVRGFAINPGDCFTLPG